MTKLTIKESISNETDVQSEKHSEHDHDDVLQFRNRFQMNPIWDLENRKDIEEELR
jgi:hypothetical protein